MIVLCHKALLGNFGECAEYYIKIYIDYKTKKYIDWPNLKFNIGNIFN